MNEAPKGILIACLAGLGLLERRVPKENVDGLRMKVTPVDHPQAQRLATDRALTTGGEVTEDLFAKYLAQVAVFAGSRIDFVPSDHPVAFVFPIVELLLH